MKKSTKKKISALLIAAITLSMLAGCGQSTSSSSSQASSEASTSKSSEVSIGTNDMGIIDDDLWVEEDKSQPAENVLIGLMKNYRIISNLAKENNIPLTICSLPPSNFVQPFKCEERKALAVEINKCLKDFAKEEGHDYINYHKALSLQDGITIDKELCFDGVHPNAKGYKVMRDVLVETYPDLRK